MTEATCKICGAPFKPRTSQVTCGAPACKAEQRRLYMAARRAKSKPARRRLAHDGVETKGPPGRIGSVVADEALLRAASRRGAAAYAEALAGGGYREVAAPWYADAGLTLPAVKRLTGYIVQHGARRWVSTGRHHHTLSDDYPGMTGSLVSFVIGPDGRSAVDVEPVTAVDLSGASVRPGRPVEFRW